jgi:hypothetical protein
MMVQRTKTFVISKTSQTTQMQRTETFLQQL